MSDLSKKIAQELLKIGAVKLNVKNPYTWASGIVSPIYCDNRMLISHVEVRNLIVDAFVKIIKETGEEFDFVAGTATAAIPWAAFVAQALETPMIYIRSEKKGHGAGKQIEGDLKKDTTVILLEDLISTGGSSLKAVTAIEEEGKSSCDKVYAIVTYGLSEARNAFNERQKTVTTLTDFGTIFEVAVEGSYIDESEKAILEDFISLPRDWASKYA